MKTAYILIGPSGSGKSTKVAQLLQEFEDAEVFSLDQCRLAFLGAEKFDYTVEEKIALYKTAFDNANAKSKEFDSFMNASWKSTLDASTVIVDNTNLSRKSRTRWVQDLQKKDFHITMIEFHVSLNTLLARQLTRPEKRVPEEAVRQQYFRQEAALLGTECDEVQIVMEK